MNALSQSPLVGRGLYPLVEAARIAQLPPQTARRWAMGHNYTSRGEHKHSSGLVGMELPELAGRRDVTFSELLTLRLVRSFRRAGLSLRTIRLVAEKAEKDFGGPAPMVTRRFRTDGRRILLEMRKPGPANDEPAATPAERRLFDVLSGQEQFAEVVEASLFQNLEWEDDLQASRWWPGGRKAGVVLDPAVLFGAPRLADTSLSTEAVARAVAAEGGGEAAIEAAADWLGINEGQVRQAMVFEREWLAKAA